MVRNLLLAASLMLCISAHAFEQTVVQFSPSGTRSSNNVVKLTFEGRTFTPEIDVKGELQAPDSEAKPFLEFIQKMYRANLDGGKQAILSVWSPSDRSQIESKMTPQLLSANKSKFQSMTAVKVRMIVRYGAYFIAYVQTAFGQQSFVMKFPIKIVQGQYYLTNDLNGDFFYDNISQFLDRSNFTKSK